MSLPERGRGREEAGTYEEVVVGGLCGQLLAVGDGLGEGGAEGDGGHLGGFA